MKDGVLPDGSRKGKKMYEIGIDMGGTHTAVGLVDGLALKDRVEFAVLFAFVDVAFDDQRIENADENVVNANEHGKNLISFWDIFFSWPLCPA